MYCIKIVLILLFWAIGPGCRTEPSGDRTRNSSWREVKFANPVPEGGCGYSVDRLDEFRNFAPNQVQEVFERRIPFIPRDLKFRGELHIYFCVDERGNLTDVQLILLKGVFNSDRVEILFSAVEWMIEELQDEIYLQMTKEAEPTAYNFIVKLEIL